MILKMLEIQNFMGIGSGSVSLNNRPGITLIQGVNNDSPSSMSNGAGKSSIFEALFWGLYGKTKRGLSGDDVVNESAGGDCAVSVYFDNYKITRGRKPKVLTFQQLDGSGSVIADMTKGTDKETQELIESTIKISELTFSKMAYFGQEDVKPFASLTDAELKKVFEQALGLSFLTDHQTKAKAHMQVTRASLDMHMQAVAQANMAISETEEKIDILKRAAEDLKTRRISEESRIISEMAESESALAALKQSYIETSAKAKECEAAVKVHREELEKLNKYAEELSRQRSKQSVELGSVKNCAASIEKELRSISEKINSLPGMVGQACETCKRPYSAEDMKAVRESAQEKLKARLAEYKLEKERAESLGAKVNQIEEVVKKLDAAITTQREKVASITAVNNPAVINQTLSQQVEGANALVKKISDYKLVLSKLGEEETTYKNEIKLKEQLIEDKRLEVEKLGCVVKELQKEFETAEMLVEVLGNAGMKSYIFDSVTPELNKQINKFARVLDDIEIEVSTVKPLKSGEYREKFHIDVKNAHGSSKYEGNSGGEKQKVNLPIALGFNKVFRAMSEESVNVILLDEPFESLDKGSSEAVIELCKMFTDTGNVLVITHQDSIKDLITDVITVEKNGKKAVVK